MFVCLFTMDDDNDDEGKKNPCFRFLNFVYLLFV